MSLPTLPVLAAFYLSLFVLSVYFSFPVAVGSIVLLMIPCAVIYYRARKEYDLANNPLYGLLREPQSAQKAPRDKHNLKS